MALVGQTKGCSFSEQEVLNILNVGVKLYCIWSRSPPAVSVHLDENIVQLGISTA